MQLSFGFDGSLYYFVPVSRLSALMKQPPCIPTYPPGMRDSGSQGRDRSAREVAFSFRSSSKLRRSWPETRLGLRPKGRSPRTGPPRSEEHTSELQSPCNLVC